MKIFVFLSVFLVGCAAHDIQPYQFEALITTQSYDGGLSDHRVVITTRVSPESGNDIVIKSGDCLNVKGSTPYVLECNVEYYTVKSMNCVNCGK